MRDFVIKEFKGKDIELELERLGFDSAYKKQASDKYRYKTFKIFDLTPAQANIIKQTALTVGADCAAHREVITGNIEKSDVLLGGSFSQFRKISEKFKYQPFSLGILSDKILAGLEKKEGKTKFAGILNITPDSFSDGGEYYSPDRACSHFLELIKDGADMIDIGAESTRPGAAEVSAGEQIRRIKPVLEFAAELKKGDPASDLYAKELVSSDSSVFTIPVLSLDTRSADTAEFGLENGVSIINDVSGLEHDKKMADVIAKYKAGVIIQHSKGTPENMQENPYYENLIEEIFFSLKEKVDFACSKGIENIIIDPGIGFGKTKADNYEIIDRIEEFYSLNLPVMVGVSRKSLLGLASSSDNNLKDALSLALSYPLIKKGVDYLRVHNVKLHKQLANQAG